MAKSRNTDDRPVKAKKLKSYTRAQAERAIASGAVPPERFLDMSDPYRRAAKGHVGGNDQVVTVNHSNFHVRSKCWVKMGRPIPSDWSKEDIQKFYDSIHFKPKVVTVEPPPETGLNELPPGVELLIDNEPVDHPT